MKNEQKEEILLEKRHFIVIASHQNYWK